MRVEILADAEAVAHRAAGILATEARAAVAARGRFLVALSGGHTPWLMLRALAAEEVPWEAVAGGRRSTSGWPRRATRTGTSPTCAKACSGPPRSAPSRSTPCPWRPPTWRPRPPHMRRRCRELAGTPPILDFVHLGLGADGHTASLVPGDPVLEVTAADVAVTGVYQGRRRMTLTYPIIESRGTDSLVGHGA